MANDRKILHRFFFFLLSFFLVDSPNLSKSRSWLKYYVTDRKHERHLLKFQWNRFVTMGRVKRDTTQQILLLILMEIPSTLVYFPSPSYLSSFVFRSSALIDQVFFNEIEHLNKCPCVPPCSICSCSHIHTHTHIVYSPYIHTFMLIWSSSMYVIWVCVVCQARMSLVGDGNYYYFFCNHDDIVYSL